MTEKNYGGSSGFGFKEKTMKSQHKHEHIHPESKSKKDKEESYFSKEEISKLEQAGKIASEVVKYAITIAKPQVPLLELAEKIEYKIIELGGLPAFPVNLSINEVAAHSTPAYDSEEKAHGLLKIDLGVHISGFVADTAISIDLENSKENKSLIEAAQSALKKAAEKIKLNSPLKELGSVIEKEIKSLGFQPIANLSGHSIDQYNLHAGITIPNFDNSQSLELPQGVYAIEPFTTNGSGSVRDGKPSGIYHLESANPVRDSFAREVLEYIAENYQTLPFCSRWLVKKFGTRALIALKRLEEANCLHSYPQLIEKSKGIVAQAEHTILLTEKEKIITTL